MTATDTRTIHPAIHPTIQPQRAGASPSRLQVAGMNTHWKCHQFKREMQKSHPLFRSQANHITESQKDIWLRGSSCWCFWGKSRTEGLMIPTCHIPNSILVMISYVSTASNVYIRLPRVLELTWNLHIKKVQTLYPSFHRENMCFCCIISVKMMYM